MSKRDILVVFDIDETLIQFITSKSYHYWKDVTPEQKQIIDDNFEYNDNGKEVVIFRPGIKEFFEMALNSGRIKVALWTLSEREYSNDIGQAICDKFGLPEDMFVFNYGAEDISDDSPTKSMNDIWTDPKYRNKFNKFNTFIVDDRFKTLCHKVNKYNSILVQAFAPFGESKAREPLTEELLTKAVNDNIFEELSHIVNNILRDIDGCEDEEIEEAFDNEAIFAPKCIERKNLLAYVKQYGNDIELCTIGEVDNAASSIKGGKSRNKSRKNRGKHLQIYKFFKKTHKRSKAHKHRKTHKHHKYKKRKNKNTKKY
jgi:hypothetical protein